MELSAHVLISGFDDDVVTWARTWLEFGLLVTVAGEVDKVSEENPENTPEENVKQLFNTNTCYGSSLIKKTLSDLASKDNQSTSDLWLINVCPMPLPIYDLKNVCPLHDLKNVCSMPLPIYELKMCARCKALDAHFSSHKSKVFWLSFPAR